MIFTISNALRKPFCLWISQNCIGLVAHIYFLWLLVSSNLRSAQSLVKEFVRLKARLPDLKRIKIGNLSKCDEAKLFMQDCGPHKLKFLEFNLSIGGENLNMMTDPRSMSRQNCMKIALKDPRYKLAEKPFEQAKERRQKKFNENRAIKMKKK